MGLDLYAKLEPLIPFENEIVYLYDAFIEKMEELKPTSILDVGCGNGNFIKAVQNCGFSNIEGIDLSKEMVKIAKQKGVEAEHIDIAQKEGQYEMITAVFDVLNYLDTPTLKSFLKDAHRLLKPGGVFIADINSQYGFEEIAPGSLLVQKDNYYGSLDAEYEKEVLTTKLRLFTPKESLFEMSEDTIIQYYHPISRLKKLSPFQNMRHEPLNLYGEEADKHLLLFTK
jgi:2-polyprenyl-3-methyl-5-hydroxy-6-metoxy-1,4-benzoquinol methylase